MATGRCTSLHACQSWKRKVKPSNSKTQLAKSCHTPGHTPLPPPTPGTAHCLPASTGPGFSSTSPLRMMRSRGGVTHATAIRYRRRRGTRPFTTRALVLEGEGARAFFAPPPFSSHRIRLQLNRPTDTRHCWAEMGMTACKGERGEHTLSAHLL